jgi:hypothetical protein
VSRLLASVFAALALAAGCDRYRALRRSAAVEHSCSQDRVRVLDSDGNFDGRTVRVSVCGQRRIYREVAGVWLDTTNMTASGSPQRPPERQAWSDDQLRSFVAATRAAVLECTGGQPTEVVLTVDAGGRAGLFTFDSDDPVRRRCLVAALSSFTLSGIAGQRRFSYRYAPPTAGGETPAAADERADFGATVRSRIDARATAVLACVGGDAAAIEAIWDAGGSVRFSVRGTDDAAVNECVASAIGAVAVGSGAAGRLVHAVAR